MRLLLISSVLMAAGIGTSYAEDESVTLQWQPSLSNGVVGYNIYRSQTSGSGYQKINSQLIAGTQFTDENILPGVDYYYVCRAVTIEGVESINSNEANYLLEDLNAAPEAADDTAQTNEDSWVDISPLGNDYDSDGDFLEIVSLTQPSHGTAEINSTSEIRYTPNPDFYGQDTFTYTAADPGGQESTGEVTVQVAAVNDPPQAANDVIATNEDTAKELNVLANDTDPDGDVLTVTLVQNPAHGNVQILSGGVCRYTPSSDFSGSDLFTYQISDSSASSSATVNVTVAAVNDKPVAANDSFTTTQDTNASFSILANDSDPEGDVLNLAILTQPAMARLLFSRMA